MSAGLPRYDSGSSSRPPGQAPDWCRQPRPDRPCTCAEVDGDLAELALGGLAGEERTAVLAHLASCERCSTELASLASVGDALLVLAPQAEPAAGFEASLLERRRASASAQAHGGPVGRRAGDHRPGGLSRTGRRRAGRWAAGEGRKAAWAVGAAAVIAVFVLGGLAGHLATRQGGAGGRERAVAGRGSSLAPLEAASLEASGHRVGSALVYAGNPTWVFMYMDDPHWQGQLRCEVVLDDGPVVVLGRFWLAGGRGAWAESIEQPAGRLREARVVDAEGRVLAVAALG